MTINDAIEVLRKHNEWRRYSGEIDKSPELTDPTTLGEAIDTVVEHFLGVKKMVLEEEIRSYFKGTWPGTETAEQCNTDMHFTPLAIMRLAEHFAKWGAEHLKK